MRIKTKKERKDIMEQEDPFDIGEVCPCQP